MGPQVSNLSITCSESKVLGVPLRSAKPETVGTRLGKGVRALQGTLMPTPSQNRGCTVEGLQFPRPEITSCPGAASPWAPASLDLCPSAPPCVKDCLRRPVVPMITRDQAQGMADTG